ncbi:FAD-dependent monooxygenase [bacterium]|nr:FAD-dependent monooxygenase [bacterium]
MADHNVDILIVGGGLIGALLMLALADMNLTVLLVEAKPLSSQTEADFDARTLALSPASVRILQMLNVWPLLSGNATAIETIHVSEQHCFGSTRLQGHINNPLGYVVEMQHISHALNPLINDKNLMAPAKLSAYDATTRIATVSSAEGECTIQARLVVAADGADSAVRHFCGLDAQIKEYGQQALVANIGLARPHHQCAYERFTQKGSLALLPMTHLRQALIWALPASEAQRLRVIPESDFLINLQRAFGYRLGRFVQVGQRVIYPLRQVSLPKLTFGSVVFVGNAAHTLHPIAGQGFNLGLRDVAMLAQCITQYGLGSDMLQHYQQSRHHDQTAITRSADALVELFRTDLPGAAFARSMGLMALDNIPLLKNVLSRYARGYAGIIPDLVCGIPLGGEYESVV